MSSSSPNLPHGSAPGLPPRTGPRPEPFGILSTFPPTECGIATFSAALADGHHHERRQQSMSCDAAPPRLWRTRRCSARSTRATSIGPSAPVDVLNRTDVAIVQHEYGIYDGPDGAEIVDIVSEVEVPMIVVAHTVVDLAERQPEAGPRAGLRGRRSGRRDDRDGL